VIAIVVSELQLPFLAYAFLYYELPCLLYIMSILIITNIDDDSKTNDFKKPTKLFPPLTEDVYLFFTLFLSVLYCKKGRGKNQLNLVLVPILA
jgi:hypothetical protein